MGLVSTIFLTLPAIHLVTNCNFCLRASKICGRGIMELSGQLHGFELVDLLQMLGLGRKTGTLLVKSQREWLALVIVDGRLLRILSYSIPYEQFGKLLVESGSLYEELLDDLLGLQQGQPKRPLGEIVRDYGLNDNS